MKTVFLSIALFLLSLVNAENLHIIPEPPEHTILLNVPNQYRENWKDITHQVTSEDALIERVPLNQTKQNWSKLITLQYRNTNIDLETFIENLQQNIRAKYGNEASYRIIEKNQDDAIFEWTTNRTLKSKLPEHQILRIFFTDNGLYSAGITNKGGSLSAQERQEWVKIFKDATSLVSFRDALRSDGMSLASTLRDSVDLKRVFPDWVLAQTCIIHNGFTNMLYISPNSGDKQVCIEVETIANVRDLDLNTYVEAVLKPREEINRNPTFRIIERSPSEIICTYRYVKNQVPFTGITRTALNAHGFYTLHYKEEMQGHMKPQELQAWVKKLKSIPLGFRPD